MKESLELINKLSRVNTSFETWESYQSKEKQK